MRIKYQGSEKYVSFRELFDVCFTEALFEGDDFDYMFAIGKNVKTAEIHRIGDQVYINLEANTLHASVQLQHYLKQVREKNVNAKIEYTAIKYTKV